MTTESEIKARIDASLRELLDLSLRNRLLNYRTTRGRGVSVTGENPMQVFDTLVRKRRRMSFLARPGQDNVGEEDLLVQPELERPANQEDSRLQTAESSAVLQRRLLNTYRTANILLEEQGLNTLFLALGMAVWHEADSSSTPHHAPLVLVPVSITREGIDRNFRIEYTGEEIGSNLSFIEKARADFSIDIPLDIPGRGPKGQRDAEDLDVESYFTDVADSFGDASRWHVDTGSVVLGFFSFTKFLMYRDLDPSLWPKILDHRTVQALFGTSGFNEPRASIEDDEHLDDHLAPEDVYHVLDADSSQSLAIHDAASGRNLVIQGPPGTGKSQTNANIIADAVARDKRVLFVSEKMAALEVVKRRLDNVGLGDACLELHSHKTTKRAVIDELRRTWELGRPRDEGVRETLESLATLRHDLNEYADAVNSPVGNTGVTPFDAFGELLRIRDEHGEGELPQLTISGVNSWSKTEFDRRRSLVVDLQTRLSTMRTPNEHPFWGSRLHERTLLPSEQEGLRGRIHESSRSLEDLVEASRGLALSLQLNAPADLPAVDSSVHIAGHVLASPDLRGVDLGAPGWETHKDEINELVNTGTEIVGIHAKYDQVLLPDAWNADVRQTRQTINTKGRGFFSSIFSSDYRRANSHLATLCRSESPKDIEAKIELADAILEEQRLRRALARLSGIGTAALGKLWQGNRTQWRHAKSVSNWIFRLMSDIADGKVDQAVLDSLKAGFDGTSVGGWLERVKAARSTYVKCVEGLQVSLELATDKGPFPNGIAGMDFDLQSRVFSTWSGQTEAVNDIVGFNITASAARDQGLAPVVELAEGWGGARRNLVACFERSFFESILARALSERHCLSGFDRNLHEKSIEDFREMDLLSLERNRARVAAVHWRNMPENVGVGQLGVLTREFNKRRNNLPIRQLMARAGNAIQAIKPVFMMSPMSVATYLPPDAVQFDLVVFDEASQVRPMDALGSLVRADKAVVVGDSKQLPPSNFFESITGTDAEEEESSTADIDSILDMFLAQRAPSKRLRWHYRSKHESLIALSNREFYENSLVVFPSPDAGRDILGLRFHYLPESVYDRGRSRVNRIEAQAVANAVMKHAVEHPDLTLGVAAFSSSQAQAILDELELQRKSDPSCEAFFKDHPEEPLFVKNLENVQGDERDVIFISVGYGKDETGRAYQNFGPINNPGGERRLNVIITRAKMRCHVFTNLRSQDIVLQQATPVGVRALRAFLAYAETNILGSDVVVESGRDCDSPFQRSVASALRDRGYDVSEEISSGGYFVDLAVRDQDSPGSYILGIECDGAMYHSARSARDRDRLRESVLEGLGWRLHRIWSTDWFRRPQMELEQAIQAIEGAKIAEAEKRRQPERSQERSPSTGSSSSVPAEPTPPAVVRHDVQEESTQGARALSYVMAEISVNLGGSDLHLLPIEVLVSLVGQVVLVEGPVHVDSLVRRITNGAGLSRAGSRIRRALEQAIDVAVRRDQVVRSADFLSVPGQAVVVRDRRGNNALLKIGLIAPGEISEAVMLIVKSSYGIDRADAIAATARLMGFASVSRNIREEIDRIIRCAVSREQIAEVGGHLTVPD